MVAGTSDGACRQDRRRALAASAAGRSRDAKTVRCSSGLLADVTVRQLWPVRTEKHNVRDLSDVMRSRRRWSDWNDPGVGERLRNSRPYLTAADAPGRQSLGIRAGSKRIRGAQQLASSVPATACGLSPSEITRASFAAAYRPDRRRMVARCTGQAR